MITRIKEDVVKGKDTRFIIHDDNILCFQGRLCVPNDEDLMWGILQEVTPYSVHPGKIEMYKDLKQTVD